MAKKTKETKKTTIPKKGLLKKNKEKKELQIQIISEKKTIKKPKTSKNIKKYIKISKPIFQNEYYDFPNNYNQTIVTILSQTPTTLFVYWELSDYIQNEFKKTYGDNFFEVTTPILIVYNDTLNYSFEVDINDFANSWYIHIKDPDCNYHIELGRKPLPIANSIHLNTNPNQTPKYVPYYVYISSSNNTTTPNNKIHFNFNQKITFRNLKTNEVVEKNIQDFTFITNLGIYKFNELYKTLYPNEDLYKRGILLNNPSSGSTSSHNRFF